MLVNYDLKSAVLCGPRTASSMLRKVLTEDHGWEPIGGHHDGPLRLSPTPTPEKVARWQKEDPKDWQFYTTVRNPFDALVSWWAQKVENQKKNRERFKPPISVGFLKWLWEDSKTVFPHAPPNGHPIFWRFAWEKYGGHATNVFRFEQLEKDLRWAFAVWGHNPPETFPVVNATPTRPEGHYRDFWSPEAVAYFSATFKEELARLGYEF
jgi:hypothetical protein